MHFKLVHFRLAPLSWKHIGLGVGGSKALRTFAVHGTNIGALTKSSCGAMIAENI
jgi:hypothetical protein